MHLTFTVPGIAQTAGSKRAFPFRKAMGLGVRVTDDNPKSRDWKTLVAVTARQHYVGELLTGPVRLTLRFVFPRPKGHFGARGLKPSAPVHHTVKPDALKLTRAVEDALTGVVWRDDAQIVVERIYKEYGPYGFVEIEVETL